MNDRGDTKILLMCYMEEDDGYRRMMVSHGIGNNSLTTYIMPDQPLDSFDPQFEDNQPYLEAD